MLGTAQRERERRGEADGDAVAAADDAALVAAAQRDPRAFAPLYERYVDPIYRYCYHRLGHREAAEDATALVFVKALAALPRCRPERFRSWLFAIAHNTVADAHRQRTVRPLLTMDAAAEVADPTPAPDELALAADERRSVRALLAALTPEQARVLELRLAGLTEAEIAQVLGRSGGAVRSVQFRAITRLRALLGVETGGQEVPDANPEG